LLIPRSSDPALLASAPRVDRNPLRAALQTPSQYTVKNGDNLWSIARRFELRSKDIAAWNKISTEKLLQPGQVLDFSFTLQDKSAGPQLSQNTATYIVRSGDSYGMN
jgi:LysM repeat protein